MEAPMQTAGEFARHIDFTAGPPEAKVLIEARDREVRLDELKRLFERATRQPRAMLATRIAELEAQNADRK